MAALLAAYNFEMNKRVLLICYDEKSLRAWKMILDQEGFEVHSALGFAEALEICQVRCKCDLVVMGDSMPQKDQTTLLVAIRTKCTAPLLSVRKHDDSPLPVADYWVDSFGGPSALRDAVKEALHSQP